jgi:exodeoxyribonuclease-3
MFNQNPEEYSWWSYRANSRNNNKGWRIDYHMASTEMKERLVSADILNQVIHSDHCPIVLEIR